MRNLRKLLSVLLVVAMMVTTMIPAFALTTDASAAQICSDLEILKGTSDEGVTDAYLGTESQRYQSATILLRLMGVYEDALAFDSTDNFADATDLEWTEGRPLLAFLKANSEYGFQGSTSGNFFPNNVISAQEFDKVLLTALGYEQGTDFTWDETSTFAKFVGLKALDGKGNLTNNDLAEAIVEALSTDVKDGDGYTLAQKLADEGVIDPAIAEEYGLIAPAAQIAELAAPEDIVVTAGEEVVLPETVSATWDNDETTDEVVTWDTSDVDFAVAGEYEITGTVDGTDTTVIQKVTVNALAYTATAKVSGASKIDVTFNQPVDTTKATFTLKKGLVSLVNTVTYNEDKTVATITAANKFTVGTYTVVVNGLGMEKNSIDVVAANETLTKIDITGDTLAISDAAPFGFKVLNQYGEDMSTTYKQVQWFLAPQGKLTLGTTDTPSFDTKVDNNLLKAGDIVTVIAISGAVQATHTFTITDAPALATLTLGAITNDDVNKADRTKLYAGETGTMSYEAYDQYGNKIEDSATLSAVQFVYSSNNVDVSWHDNAGKGEIKVHVGALNSNENVTVTALTFGKVYGSTQFTAYAAPAMVSTTITAPTSVVANGDTADFELNAVDQYGNAISTDAIKAAYNHGLTVYVGSASVACASTVTNNDAGKAVVRLSGINGEGIVTVTVMTNGLNPQSASLTVQPARFAQTIQFVEGTTKLVPGATSTLTYKLLDQYGAEFKGDATVEFDPVKVSGDDGAFVKEGIVYDSAARKATITAVAGKKGEYNLTAKITDNNMTLNSVTNKIVSVDSAAETITYTVNDIPTLYRHGAAGFYDATISVSAKDAAGNPVAIPADALISVNSTDTSKVVAVGNAVYGIANGTAVVTVSVKTNTGNIVVTKVATVSESELAAQSIVAKQGDNVVSAVEFTGAKAITDLFDNPDFKFVVTDQFGGTSLSSLDKMQIIIVTPAGATEVKKLGDSEGYTFSQTGKYAITAVTFDGKVCQATITIK